MPDTQIMEVLDTPSLMETQSSLGNLDMPIVLLDALSVYVVIIAPGLTAER